MAFGSILRLQHKEFIIELAPFKRENMGDFINPGLQSAQINRYLATGAKVLEDEYEWFEKTRTDETSLCWGVWIVHDNNRELIGTTSLHHIEKGFFYQAGSGSMLFRQDYWGKGIASAIHRARTWYGFHILGLDRIWSEVIQGNVASRKALEKSGYYVTNVMRNTKFANGKLRHSDQLECINPASWKRWWGEDRPTKAAKDARTRTLNTIQWASENVILP